MSTTLLMSLIGIALVDSLNPSLFIAQFYLLTTPQPIPRLLSYIVGIVLVNVSGGMLLLGGVQPLVTTMLSTISEDTFKSVQLVVGLASVGFGMWMTTTTVRTSEVKKPRSLQPRHAFVLGMVVMLNEITTALPYFVAIERIVQAQLSGLNNMLALMLYNVVFSAPLFVFVALFVMFRQRFAAQLNRITQVIQQWTPRVIKYGALLFGVIVTSDAVAYLLRGILFSN